ncbi:MFS transporter [Sphingomonadaceae bacterium OTU29THOMA1]|nr:MFS transporter [Sphingomonadaceae bacterium OTU29THOMA1]
MRMTGDQDRLFGWYHALESPGRRTFWGCFGGYALDALDVHLFGFVAPVLAVVWGLGHAELGAVTSATLIASAIGGWGAGMLADRIGRVRTLQITIIWFSVFAFLSGLAPSYPWLVAFRALQGIGFGGEWTMSAVLMAEVVRPAFRGRTLGFVQSAWAIGWGGAAALATVAQLLLPQELAWRLVFLVGIVPAGFVIFVRRLVPESPEYLLARPDRLATTAIFRSPWRRGTLMGTMLAFGAHGGYYSLTTWLPMLLRTERHMALSAAGAYYFVQTIGALLGYWAGAYASDAIGRRKTFSVFAAASVGMLLIVTLAPLSAMTMIVLAAPLGFAAAGIYSGLGAQLAELYPTEFRGSGQGFCYNAGRGGAALLPVMVGVLSPALGLPVAVALLGAAPFAFVILIAAILPETAGQALGRLGGRHDGQNSASALSARL